MSKSIPVFLGLLCAALCVPAVAVSQTAPAPLHVLKISSGPSGTETNGTFLLTEQREKFSRTADREVIVLFSWEGVPGPHKLEAKWRSPDGGFTSNSVIDYVAAERRFGAYWRIAITPNMQLGMWSLEATVDGQPGGRFTFEVTDAANLTGTVPRRAMSQAELYEALRRSYVLLNRMTGDGREMDSVGAVLTGAGQMMTAIHGLDAVGRITAVFPDGSTEPVASITAVNRAAGWALAPAAASAGTAATPAKDAPKVGDRCYSMQSSTNGARVLLEGQITGIGAGVDKNAGWMASFFNGLGTSGSPVVNEYGELLGILGGPAGPVVQSIRNVASADLGNMPVMPVSSIPPGALPAPVAIDAVRAAGHLLTPLEGDVHVVSGGFAASIDRGPTVRPQDQRVEFSPRDASIVVFVTWAPRTPLKGQTTFHVYDAGNRLIASSKPTKINFRKNDLVMSSMKLSIPQQPGVYRAELHLDGKPAWRSNVRITP
jgi:hypothetical protein